jgi:drug/metabolite transporter (DMT)-like permease
MNLATLAVLVSAVCYALNAVSVRILGRTDSTAAMSFWFIVVIAVCATLLALPNWQPLRLTDAGWLLALGITGALGQVWFTAAFRSAPVSVIAPFEYTTLFWGVALDLAIWGKLPPPIVFVGAAVIVGSGLYVIRRESKSSLPVSPSVDSVSD